jgi:hypothetical protein
LGGVGTNPEYAVKSTDKFLTPLPRIRVEPEGLTEGAGAEVLGTAEPLRPLPQWQRALSGGLAQVRLAAGYEPEGNAKSAGRRALAERPRRRGEGAEQTRNVP